MHMTFFWTTDLGPFFFKGVNVDSVTSMAIACAVCALLAIAYEGIKVYSAHARAKTARELIAAVSCAPSESANLLVTENNNSNSFSRRFFRLINETMVFFFHNSIGYALMLSVMVYSGWLFMAVVLSMGLGYFFFGHVAMKINMESIQARTLKVICSPACLHSCAETGTVTNGGKIAPNCCPNAPQEATTSQCTSTAVSSCHENQVMCEVNSSPEDCQDENEASPSNNEAGAEESCSCRL